MLLNTGFMANQAILKNLPKKNDLILADKYIHHSMAQALNRGSTKFKRYNHLDLEELEELLINNINKYDTMFVVTESVFSMDGESIWRINDGGTFSAKTFILDQVLKSSEGYLNFSFSWKGKYTTNQFNLVDQSGLLIKEFINYSLF